MTASVLIAAWLGLAGLYLALVGSASFDEAAAAVVCGGLGASWVWRLTRCGEVSFAIGFDAFRPLGRALARLPKATLQVGTRLVRSAWFGSNQGAIRPATPEEAVGRPFGDGSQAAGRRAVSVLATSLAPDSYVLRLDHERGRLLVHTFDRARSVR